MRRSELIKIIELLEKNSRGPLQGSVEWYKIRQKGSRARGNIGGSDIATLLGKNKYKSRRKLMLEKQGKLKPISLDDKLDVWFGSLFEEVAVMSYEHKYKTKIFCKNICVIQPCGLEYFMFSPDGVTTLPQLKDGIVNDYRDINNLDTDCSYAPVLIEIKCPMSRPLTKDGNVPEHYMPQMQAGMMSIPLVKHCIFIDNQIRVCSWEDLDKRDGTFNRRSLHSRCNLPEDARPIHRGVIYVKKAPSYLTKFLDIVDINGKKLFDFGTASYKTFTKLLVSIKKGEIEVEYSEIIRNKYDKNILNDKLINQDITGIVSWKLFNASYTLVHRDDTMVNGILKTMNDYAKGGYDIDDNVVIKVKERIDDMCITFD